MRYSNVAKYYLWPYAKKEKKCINAKFGYMINVIPEVSCYQNGVLLLNLTENEINY